MLVLPMQVRQQLARLLERGQRHGRLIQGRARASLSHLTAHHERLAVEIESHLREKPADALGAFAREAELGFGHRGRAAMANALGGGALADDEIHGVDHERLTGAGLSREHVEPRAEGDLRPLDQSELTNDQTLEHQSRLRRSGPSQPSLPRSPRPSG